MSSKQIEAPKASKVKSIDWHEAKRRARQASGVGLLLALSSVCIYQNLAKFSPIQRGGMIAIASALVVYWIFND